MKELIDEEWSENDRERLKKLGKSVGVSNEILESSMENKTGVDFEDEASFSINSIEQIDEDWTEKDREKLQKGGKSIGVSNEILEQSIMYETDGDSVEEALSCRSCTTQSETNAAIK